MAPAPPSAVDPSPPAAVDPPATVDPVSETIAPIFRVADQPRAREVELTDPDGNRLRIGQVPE